MKYILKGLGCANCATKMETRINSLEGIKSASINFTTETLDVQFNENINKNDLLPQIINIVKDVESNVEVIEKTENSSDNETEEDNSSKKKFYKILLSGIIFISGIIFDFSKQIELAIFLLSYCIIGYDVVFKAIKNIFKGNVFDENFLMSVATIGAFAIGEFNEAVAVMLFYKVGEYLQDIAVEHSRKSISALMDIRPDYANLKLNDVITKVPPEQVSIGDIIVVKAGEKVPLDGIVIEGKSLVDTSALTGESVPKEVQKESIILSGTINKTGYLTVKVTSTYENSTVSKILDLVQNATSKKAKTENFITKFAKVYTPIVVILAVIIAVLPTIFLKDAIFSEWLYRALVFLVISCPCALVISIPLSFFGGIGGASKRGILIKGANYLEALNNVETVVFDKTGTLTKGVFTVTDIVSQGNYTKEELLEYAAYAESYSNHPIAGSIVKAYAKEIDKTKISNYTEISGNGIKINVDNKSILVGNTKLMDSENILYNKQNIIGTVVHVAIDNEYTGYVIISDIIKEDSKKAITNLKSVGVRKTVMLTGDNSQIAEQIANKLGLDRFISELLPHQKVEELEILMQEKQKNKNLIFVGDGINDAPVLARADIGIAMGGIGSDSAIEASDVVIMTDEPSKIVTAIKIAKKTHKIVMQNIGLAMGIKLIAMLLGIIGMATIWEAVIADVGVTILAVLNSMRVLNSNNIE